MLSLSVVIIGYAVNGPVALAQTWDGGGDGSSWTTTNGAGNSHRNNWNPNVQFNTGDNAIFAGTTGLNPTIGAVSLAAGSITFDNTAGAFTIGGTATLTINGGVVNNDNSLQSFSVSTITLGAAQTWNAGTVSGGGLAFTGTTLNLGASQTLTIAGTNNTSISNLITGTGTSGILKIGTGALTLSNSASTYAGATTIRGGSLIIGANAPSGSAGALGNTSSAIVLGDGSTAAGDAPALLINGAFTVGRAITVGSVANTAAYNATIGGSNTTGTSTYSGSITLNTTAANYTTTLQAANGGTVDFTTGTWTTNNKAIVIGSSGNTGTVKLSNTLSTTGGISVNFGTFLLGSSDRLGDTTPVTVAGGILDIAGNSDTVGTVTLSNGSINGTSGVLTGTSYAVQNGSISAILGGSGALTKSTAGTVTLSGANTYTGGTTVSSTGTLILNNSTGSATGTGNLQVDSGATLGGSGIIATTSTNTQVNIQGLLSVGNTGDTQGSDLLINTGGSMGTTNINLLGGVTLDLFAGAATNGLNLATANDRLLINAGGQSVALGGQLNFTNVNSISPGTFVTNAAWQLFDWQSIGNGLFTGNFSNITPGLIGNPSGFTDLSSVNLAWDFTDLYTGGTVKIVAIPEPSRAVLVVIGILSLGFRRSRVASSR